MQAKNKLLGFRIVKYAMLAVCFLSGLLAMRAGGVGTGKVVSVAYVFAGAFMVVIPIVILVVDIWFTEKEG